MSGSTSRGHKVKYDRGKNTWVYADTGEELVIPWATKEDRPCIKCGKKPLANGEDPCLGNLPGVRSACCGHGVSKGFVMFDNGLCIEGDFTIDKSLMRFHRKAIKK